MSAGVAYTIATGRLFCPVAEFHEEAERLLGRPVWTHEFASHDVWVALRGALEDELFAAAVSSGRQETEDGA